MAEMKYDFKSLLDKYKAGKLTKDEANAFSAMVQSGSYKAVLEEEIDKDWSAGKNISDAETLELIYQQLQLERQSETPVKRMNVRRWWMAAAVATGLLLTGYWLVRQSMTDHAGGDKPVAVITNDIPAGRDGAILTLSTGERIVLDTTSNGNVAEEGSAVIIKEGNQLNYESSKAGGREIVYNTMSTPKGRQFSLVLADGSKVWLNAASSIRFPTAFAGKERKVEVTGEVYFEVAKDPKMPFVVSSTGQEVRVLGTEFNINSYEDETATRTTLLEGSVQVKVNGEAVILKPGEQSAVKDEKISVRVARTDDVVAWKNGFFSFRQTDVKGVMRQLERWYDVEVVYEGVDPRQSFTGKIDRSLSLAQVMKVLEQTKVNFRIEEGRKLVIMGGK